LDRLRAYVLSEGDIVVGRRGEIGRCAVVEREQAGWLCGTGCFFIKRSANFNSRFLAELIGAPQYRRRLELAATGTTMKNLSNQALQNLTIALPPLIEQQRIVAILDGAFAGLATATANAEQNRKNARDLFGSYLNSVFKQQGTGWTRRKIGDLASTQYGLSGTLNSDGKGHKIFRMGEVQNGRLVDSGQMKFIDIDSDEFDQYRMHRGDVLFNRTNSSDLVGKTGLFDLDGDYCFASYLVRVNFDPAKMNSKFATYLMNGSVFLVKIRAKAARSVNQANINATILRNETIDFPEDVNLQAKLAADFEALSIETQRLEDVYNEKLLQLAELKRSILQKAFSGELTSPSSQAIKEAAE
jgi:restriction endonuclease S subunit